MPTPKSPVGRVAAAAGPIGSRHGLDAGLEEPRPLAAAWLARALLPLDWLFNRFYGSPWNPLYKSGALAITFLLLALLTGVYLFLFYKVADPYGSVAAVDATVLGSVMRSIHRYSADLAIVAVVLHALKMLASGRTWGPRALAWISGVLLCGVLLLCGWTGLVMAWDVQGQLVAIEGARLLDLLPIFSEPISRSFAQPDAVGRAFFFMNLFAHVALPLGLAALYWVHSSRVARAPLFPPRSIHRYAIAAVVLLSVLLPVPLPPPADLLAIPTAVPLDVFYAFWLPLARRLPASQHLTIWLFALAAAVSVPWWWRPRQRAIRPSAVDESHCAGCTQCYHDCPYEAIAMVRRTVVSQLSEMVARVDPTLCVACGICSGSCAPMGVGPPGRTGRDQLRRVEELLAQRHLRGDGVVVLGCGHGIGAHPGLVTAEQVVVLSSGCSGSVHTSVIELLLRGGAGGVFLLTCPERDCLYREGPKWLNERVFHDREAELQSRVDKRRVRLAAFAATELDRARAELESFRRQITGLGEPVREEEIRLRLECEAADA